MLKSSVTAVLKKAKPRHIKFHTHKGKEKKATSHLHICAPIPGTLETLKKYLTVPIKYSDNSLIGIPFFTLSSVQHRSVSAMQDHPITHMPFTIRNPHTQRLRYTNPLGGGY